MVNWSLIYRKYSTQFSSFFFVSMYNNITTILWSPAQFYGAFQFESHPPASFDDSQLPHPLENGLSPKGLPKVPTLNHILPRNSEIKHLELCLSLRLLFVLYSDGQLVSCSISKKGLKQVDCIKAEKRLACGDAVCASAALEQEILAVGTRRGTVELYDLAESTSLIRTVSLYDWG